MMPDGKIDETTILPPFQVEPLPPRYETLGELGRGGMGIVYKARDRETGEVLAVKVLRPEIAADTQILERFKNELRLAHQITHRNVARLYEFHRSGGAVHLSMEFVEGESLRSLLQRSGKLPIPQILDLARQLAAGLSEAHRQSIAHRDLKPENIMLTANGELKVMDFGISRSFAADVTSTLAIIGTPAYMSPEQAEGNTVDHRTDIYAFGLILYEMFTGASPFTGDTAVTLALKQIRERPKPPRTIDPSVPKHVEAAILRCLEKAPAARFSSIEDAMQALEGTPVKAPRRTRMTRLQLGVAGGAVVVVLTGLGLWSWQGRGSDSVRLPMETLSLPNGVHVVLSLDHTSPSFTLAVAYGSGYRSEQPGREGVAHVTEHAMFQGSANVAAGELLTLVSDAGGIINGFTKADTCVYYDNLPANQLELAIFLEADRMRGISLTPSGLETARGVLLQELASHDADPGSKYLKHLEQLAFGNFANQRTDWATADQIRRLTIGDIASYHRTHFTTRNAAVALVGEFDPAKARALIEKYFGSIPAHDTPPRPELSEKKRSAEKRETVADAATQSPTLWVSWHMPARSDPDWFAAKRLADVMGADDAARLHTSLVKSAGVSSGVSVDL
jgi:serine/threonine protein kinase